MISLTGEEIRALRLAIKRVLPCTYSNRVISIHQRESIKGNILFESRANLRLVAIDEGMMGFIDLKLNQVLSDGRWILKNKNAENLRKKLNKATSVSLYLKNELLVFQVHCGDGSVSIFSTSSGRNYPYYQVGIPEKFVNNVILKPRELGVILKEAKQEGAHNLKLSLWLSPVNTKREEMSVTFHGKNFISIQTERKIKIEMTGEPISRFFDRVYLWKMTQSLSFNKEINFKFSESKDIGLFEGGGVTWLIVSPPIIGI